MENQATNAAVKLFDTVRGVFEVIAKPTFGYYKNILADIFGHRNCCLPRKLVSPFSTMPFCKIHYKVMGLNPYSSSWSLAWCISSGFSYGVLAWAWWRIQLHWTPTVAKTMANSYVYSLPLYINILGLRLFFSVAEFLLHKFLQEMKINSATYY